MRKSLGVRACPRDQEETPVNILNSVKDTCSMLSMSRTTFYAAVKAGEMRAVKLGNRTMVHKDEIERFIGSLVRMK